MNALNCLSQIIRQFRSHKMNRIKKIVFIFLFPFSNIWAQQTPTEIADSDYIPLSITVRLDHVELGRMIGKKNDQQSYSANYVDSIIKMFYGQQLVPSYVSGTQKQVTASQTNAVMEKTEPVYKVIVPSKEKLSDNEIQQKFQTSGPISVEKTDSGYNYVIQEKTLQEAQSTVKNNDLKKSELIASVGEKTVVIDKQILKGMNPESPLKKEITLRGEMNHANILATDNIEIKYTVQIAACRRPLSRRYIWMFIYKNPNIVNESFEDGWYKYRIDAGKSYKEARINKIKTRVPNAFIIALLNNSKIEISEAIKKTDSK